MICSFAPVFGLRQNFSVFPEVKLVYVARHSRVLNFTRCIGPKTFDEI